MNIVTIQNKAIINCNYEYMQNVPFPSRKTFLGLRMGSNRHCIVRITITRLRDTILNFTLSPPPPPTKWWADLSQRWPLKAHSIVRVC